MPGHEVLVLGGSAGSLEPLKARVAGWPPDLPRGGLPPGRPYVRCPYSSPSTSIEVLGGQEPEVGNASYA